MNPAAFTEQLNLLLQNTHADDWSARICGLLRTHAYAAVTLTDQNNQVLTHQFPENEQSHTEGETVIFSLPIYAGDTRIGTLHMRRDKPFDDTEKLAAQITLATLTILLRHIRERDETERIRRVEAVKAVINTLSFSELEAVIHIFQALGGEEGLLVAGHTADKLGITRSVVVNALRKLEGTGVIETRSLGMKGTYIRILNPLLADELNKLKH